MPAERRALRQKRHTFDSNTNGLLYLQLETELKQAILDGKYGVGERIPTEQELCQSFGMSRITVRRAVQDLVEEGLLSKVQGRGCGGAKTRFGQQRITWPWLWWNWAWGPWHTPYDT